MKWEIVFIGIWVSLLMLSYFNGNSFIVDWEKI